MSFVRTAAVPGKLIVFEGPDGVGKSTLSAAAVERLRALGYSCELMTFPDKAPGTLGRLVYDVHHEPQRFGIDALTTAAKQTLHIAAHLDAIERRIAPALAAGHHVMLDRFWWSTWAYGMVGGIDRRVLRRLIDVERAYWGELRPAAAIVVRRGAPLNRPDEQLEQWRALWDEYDHLLADERHFHAIETVHNNGSINDALAKVVAICSNALGQPLEPPTEGNESPPAAPPTNNEGLQVNRDSPAQTPGTGGAASTQLDIQFKKRSSRPASADGRRGSRSSPKNNHALNFTGVGSTPGIAPTVLIHLLPAKPTRVFDTYWRFAAERQAVFFRRLSGTPPPWTTDPILSSFKFTNCYRASDRVSQFLIRHVIYRNDLPTTGDEVFFRLILFKLFNRIETWQLLEQAFGTVTYEGYAFDAYDRVISQAMESGTSIYSAAYIMPTGGRGSGETRKHRMHLRLVERMMADGLPIKLANAKSMHRAFDLFLAYPTIGEFLAYQFVTDVNYSTITNFSEMDFVVPGPGALDGIHKCFADPGGLNEPELVKLMADRQEREFERLGLEFRTLWGRRLQLIDCQNLFCEVDKYARVAHPEVGGRSGRTRIKQRFTHTATPINYWYPPKWGLNERISKGDGATSAEMPPDSTFGLFAGTAAVSETK